MPKQADAAVRAMRDAGVPDVRFFDADMRLPAVIDAMMNSVAAWGGTDGVGSRDSGGITVNCICPDWTENRNYRTADFGVGGPGQRKPRCSDFQLSRRTSRPEEIGGMVRRLAHPMSHNVTGTTAIPIDGGWKAQ
jgi:hypothetical protein